MRLHPLLSAGAGVLAAIAGHAAASEGQAAASSASSAGALEINGWYTCNETDTSGLPGALPVPFECAEVRVPLCWDGICTSDKTIDLFVRRLRAVVDSEEERAKSVWFLQGGPGGSSTVSMFCIGLAHSMSVLM